MKKAKLEFPPDGHKNKREKLKRWNVRRSILEINIGTMVIID